VLGCLRHALSFLIRLFDSSLSILPVSLSCRLFFSRVPSWLK
jgi:hypothetical protein